MDKKTLYEIKDYEPIIEKDVDGNVVSAIDCPYIPRSIVETAMKSKDVYTFPILNYHTNEWTIDNGDGTFSTVSNEVYLKMLEWDKRYG